MIDFEIFDSKSDIGVIVYGNTEEQIIEHLILAYYNLITDIKKIQIKETLKIHKITNTFEELIIDLINELIYINDIKQFIGKEAEVNLNKKNGKFYLDVLIKGEIFNPSVHDRGFLIKAATYHNIEYKDKSIKLIFDI